MQAQGIQVTSGESGFEPKKRKQNWNVVTAILYKTKPISSLRFYLWDYGHVNRCKVASYGKGGDSLKGCNTIGV